MSRVNRREFFGMAGIAAVAARSHAQESSAVVGRYWVDPTLRALPTRPWRKIHLDFHNSNHAGKIGADFDADEFLVPPFVKCGQQVTIPTAQVEHRRAVGNFGEDQLFDF